MSAMRLLFWTFSRPLFRLKKQARSFIKKQARRQRSHYFAIQSEIDLLQKFPDYYNVEDFHFGQDMVHIGP